MSTSTMSRLNTAEIAAALNVDAGDATPLTSFTTDSRTVCPGACFIALQGPRHDASAFAEQALAAGAALVIAGKSARAHAQVLRVDNPLAALGTIAALARSRFEGPVLGITGSAGKTTLKEHLRQLIPADWCAVFPEASHNNSEGVPRTILSAQPEARCMVLELGTNAPGEIAALSRISAPTLAAFTSIGAAHLQGLGNVGGVLQEKMDLARALPVGATAFINADDALLANAVWPTGIEVVRLGLRAVPGVRTPVVCDGQALRMRSAGLRIEHAATTEVQMRSLWMALCIAEFLGVDEAHLAQAAPCVAPARLRGEIRRIGETLLILDCYNANPLSMRAALEDLGRRSGARRAVLGEMLELGSDAEEFHREVGRQVAGLQLDEVLLIGPSAPFTAEAAHAAGMPAQSITVCPTRESANTAFRTLVAHGGTVLLKGSRLMALERLLEGQHE
ncbi:MAG: UDP-N-acetylmuramoyl-tripeptide--D-alanyl-D-alanine ligase [Planctomycetes bacterium]|nr:UDP-N-acetylmuramoyl-tripeptide--D-alanyl-D-alanine ligase [Planctomycetota bacterium]